MPTEKGSAASAQIEGQKAEQARRQQEQAALMKLEKIRLDQTQRAQTLEEEAREAEQKVRPSPCAVFRDNYVQGGCTTDVEHTVEAVTEPCTTASRTVVTASSTASAIILMTVASMGSLQLSEKYSPEVLILALVRSSRLAQAGLVAKHILLC